MLTEMIQQHDLPNTRFAKFMLKMPFALVASKDIAWGINGHSKVNIWNYFQPSVASVHETRKYQKNFNFIRLFSPNSFPTLLILRQGNYNTKEKKYTAF